jgi:MYXO-CTERM domain-containing protein
MITKSLVSVSALAAITSMTHADWYAGDPSPTALVPLAAFAWVTNAPIPGYAAYTFDNFTWTNANGGMVDTIGGHFMSTLGTPITGITFAQWEIRTGVSVGNGGTLVASGSGVPVLSSTPFLSQFIGSAYVDPVARVELDVPDFALAPGNYWLGFSIGDAGVGATGYVAETVGANGIGGPLDDGNAFYFQGDGTTNPWNWVDVTATWGGPVDAAYFITEVPAPGAATLLGLGGLLAARRRR